MVFSGVWMNLAHDLVDRVKGVADIVDIIQAYVQLRKSGANFLGLCPFHSEKTPSFHVHSSRQFFYCFGCHAKGDVLKFVELMEGLSFSEALRWLAEKYGISVEKINSSKNPKVQEREILFAIHSRAAQYFQEELFKSREGRLAQQYLNSRLVSQDSIKKFNLGYAPGGANGLLQKLRRDFSLKHLKLSGLIQNSEKMNQSYDRFRKRVIFPIDNESGKIIGFGGRALGDGYPKYLNSPETPIYSKSKTLFALSYARAEIRKQDLAILVEGYLDCIALHQVGINNVIASCGTSLTEPQAKLLGRFTKKVIVNFDPDQAGKSAALRSINILLENGFKINVLSLPDQLDPDAYIKAQGVIEYRKLLQKAPSYFEHLLLQARSESSLSTVEEKVAAIDKLLPYLSRISNRIEREENTRRVVEVFGIDENAIRTEIKKATQAGQKRLTMNHDRISVQLMEGEKQTIKAILELDGQAGQIVNQLEDSKVYVGWHSENIFQKIISLFKQEGKVDFERLQELLPTEMERDVINGVVFSEGVEPRIDSCIEWIKRQKSTKEIARLQKEIEEASRSQDYKLLSNLYSKKEIEKRSLD